MSGASPRPVVLVDAREFVAGRRTGIARFLEGLLAAAHRFHPEWHILCAMTKRCRLPSALAGRAEALYLPPRAFDLALAQASRAAAAVLSPYPKLAPFLQAPAVHTVHDVLYLTHPAYRGGLLQRLGGILRLRHALAAAALSWFDSRASLEALAGMGLRAPQARVRPPAVDARFFAAENVRPSGRFLFVGNGLPHKNVDVLLEALARDEALALDLAGLVPERRAHYQRMAERLGVAARVRFLAPGDAELARLYAGAQALVLPSTAEGFGYPPLEAMAAGAPALVADIPVLREVLGDAAWFLPPDDAAAWAEAMRALCDENMRRAWAEKGRAHAARFRAPGAWRGHLADLAEVMR